MAISFVTTITKSYIPLATVLMDSVAKYHPDSSRYVVLLDGTGEDVASIRNADVIRPSDLIRDELELTVQKYIYEPIEFATALKPKLLMHALQTADTVFFVDPDMRLFAPFNSAVDMLEKGAG